LTKMGGIGSLSVPGGVAGAGSQVEPDVRTSRPGCDRRWKRSVMVP